MGGVLVLGLSGVSLHPVKGAPMRDRRGMAFAVLLAGVLSSAEPANLSNWVDPTTPAHARTAQLPGAATELTLVFSEEFNTTWEANRSWSPSATVPGDAGKKWSATYQLNSDTYGETFLHPQMVSASNGTLHLTARNERFGGAEFLGSQLSSWNRFCFQGGYLEVSFMLPPSARAHPRGVWTAIWIMGNLARDVYPASVESIWPFSYDECQCPGPAAEYGLSQKISKCDFHHSGRYGLNPEQGRGAPELDLLETIICGRQMTPHLADFGARANDTCLISSLQLAPRLPGSLRPILLTLPSEDRPWYADSVTYGERSTINAAFYGMNNYDTIGAMTVLDDSAYTGFHTVGLHVHIGAACGMRSRPGSIGPYTPAQRELCLNQSRLSYYHDGQLVTRVAGRAFRTRGGLLSRQFPQEPMYILLGLKMSPDRWGEPNPDIFPLDFQIDYVRLYQELKDGDTPRLSCSPPDHPTARWISGHHLDYGLPGTSFVSIADVLAAALLVVGTLLALAGSLELRALTLLAYSVMLSVSAGVWIFASLQLDHASSVTFAPTFLPAIIALGFLATLIPVVTVLTHAVGTALAAAVLSLQITHRAPTPAADMLGRPGLFVSTDASYAATVAIAVGVASLACALARLPSSRYEVVAAALGGSQAAAVGAAHYLRCDWLTELARCLGADVTDFAEGTVGSEQAAHRLLYASLALALLGGAYQYIRHACRGSLWHRGRYGTADASSEPQWETQSSFDDLHRLQATSNGGVRRRAGWRRLDARCKSSGALTHPLHTQRDELVEAGGVGEIDPRFAGDETSEVAWEAALVRELDLDIPSSEAALRASRADGSSAAWAVSLAHAEAVAGCSEVAALREAAMPMVRALGLQEASVEVQCTHLHALIGDARRGGLSEAEASRRVHTELTSNYVRWCEHLALRVRTCGVIHDCLLILCVWGEAANLRHMPEMLCWLFHQLAAHRDTITLPAASPMVAPAAAPAPTAADSEGASAPVLCCSFVASVVVPLVGVTRSRMRAELPASSRLTYDDLNEFFWERSCVRWLPFAHDGSRCVCEALSRCPKTHMEARHGGWLHLFHCFHRPILLSACLTVASSTLAYCATLPTPIGLYAARLSLSLWLFSLYCLSKELLDTWAEASLTPASTSAPPSLRQQGITTWRVALKGVYTTAMGALGLSAALATGCNAAGCATGLTPGGTAPPAVHSGLHPPMAALGLGDAAGRWIAFWTLGLLQLGGYTLYSRLQKRLPFVRAVFGTPYRAARIGERFYGTTLRSSKGGIAFWLVLVALYLPLHFILIATPSAKGYSNFVVLRASGAASPSEFAALVLALWLPAIPTGIIFTDVLFQILVLATSLGVARCCERHAAPRAADFSRLATSYEAARGGFAARLQPPAVQNAQRSAAGGGSAAAAPDPFGCSWDAIVNELRSRDLLSDSEAASMTHMHVPMPSGPLLIAPPLFLAPSLHAYLSEGKGRSFREAGNLPKPGGCVDNGVMGAGLLLEAIAVAAFGASHAHDVREASAGIAALLRYLSWERLRAAPLAELLAAARALCTALGPSHNARVDGGAGGHGASEELALRRSCRHLLDALAMVKQIALLEVQGNEAALEAGRRVEQSLPRLYAACERLGGSDAAGDVDATSAVAGNGEARRLAWCLMWLLDPSSAGARPGSDEARRRLRSFVRSLRMEMPPAVSVRGMGRVSLLTPVYQETVIFSLDELSETGSDGRPLLAVLRDLYADEWRHFCERTGVAPDVTVAQLLPRGLCDHRALEVRLWASMRGQTLCRTVCGMMSYRAALRLQARLDGCSDEEAESLASSRFEFVVSCQMYGEHKRTADPRADDVDTLLGMHPGLRVAYIDKKVTGEHARHAASGADDATFDAVLLVSEANADQAHGAAARVREVARVRLPGHPIVGEGKPENQNVGLPFTRGSKLMILDMNQDGYFEEALKLRNLLQEFGSGNAQRGAEMAAGGGEAFGGGKAVAGGSVSSAPRVTVVGFPEHIFTQSSGFVTAIYMAMQERYFGTFFQRVLDSPLDVRFHYGHPDLLDKVHFLARGGVSSASKQINLSEDVFAGYKTVLRGGKVVFREYHQVGKGRMTNLSEISAFFAKLSQGAACQLMSRDLYRLTKALPLDRQLSHLHGGFGFYIVNCLTMYLVQATAFLLATLNVSGLLPYFQTGSAVALTSINLWMPLIVAVVLMLPDAFMVGHERGTRLGLHYLYGKIVTLAPLYYIFIAQTRAYHFANTMRWGSADYYVTRRAVSISHTPLYEHYMAYARSHFYPASELLLTLLVATSFDAPSDMYNATWMLWFIAMSLMYVPALYNPNALQFSTVCADLATLREWLSTSGVGGNKHISWRAWWEHGTPPPSSHSAATIIGQVLMATVYAYLAGGLLLYSNTSLDGGFPAAFAPNSLWQLSLGGSVIVPAMVLAAFDSVATPRWRRWRTPLMVALLLCGLGWFVGVTQSKMLVSRERVIAGQWAGALAPTFYAVPTLVMHTITCSFGLSGVGAVLTIMQLHVPPARDALRWLHRTRDYLLLAAMTLPLQLLSLLYLPHVLQTRLVFQSSGFFFSDTRRGRSWCITSAICFTALMLALVAYELLWFLGYVNAPPFQWFDC